MSSEPAGVLVSVEGKRIALRGVDISARVRDAASLVTIRQRFVNAEDVAVEAVYSFPLEEGSAVCGFEVEIGDRVIIGRVEEKEAAFDAYDEAMAEGHGAFLLDQERPDIFTASVGNLLPGQEAEVRIRYVAELDRTDGRTRLRIPTVVSPRYIPPDMEAAGDPSDLDRISPPISSEGLSYGLTLRAEISTTRRIRSVQSPSHPITVELRDDGAAVSLTDERTFLDQDFVLTVETHEPHVPAAFLAKDGEDRTVAMIDFFPDIPENDAGPCEFVFVLDCSGSMSGESISQARSALLLCLRSLREGDRFNIFCFGSSYHSLFDKSEPYDQKNLDAATRWVKRIDANLGGTEILAPLKAVLGSESLLARNVLLLTDGEVGNEKEVIEAARKAIGDARIFTFGIGRGASEHLVRGLARAGGGAAEFIFPGERIQPKVLKQLSRLRMPYFKNVSCDWGELEPDLVAPHRMPPLFEGDGATVFARFEKVVASRAVLSAQVGEKTWRWEVEIDPEDISEEEFVSRLMARRAIRDLEEGDSPLHRTGSRQRGKKTAKIEKAILDLSVRYGLLSSVASMVAVETRKDAKGGEAELRRISVALTRGWGGQTMAGAFFSFDAGMPAAAPAPSSSALGMGDFEHLDPAAEAEAPERFAEPVFSGGGRGRNIREAAPNPTDASRRSGPSLQDRLMDLTLLQRADGSWPLSKRLAEAAGADLSPLRTAAKELSSQTRLDRETAESIVATLAALRVLETEFASQRDEWAMISEKAEKWMDDKSLDKTVSGLEPKEWIARILAGGS